MSALTTSTRVAEKPLEPVLTGGGNADDFVAKIKDVCLVAVIAAHVASLGCRREHVDRGESGRRSPVGSIPPDASPIQIQRIIVPTAIPCPFATLMRVASDEQLIWGYFMKLAEGFRPIVRGRVLTALAVITALMSVALPPVAQAADGWSFAGTIQSPPRGGTKIVIAGDITAPASLAPATSATVGATLCLAKRGWTQEYDPSLCGWKASFGPGQTKYIETSITADDGPGIYEFYVSVDWRNCETCNLEVVNVPVTGLVPQNIVQAVSSTPTISASPESVVAGERVTVSTLNQVTWSDGVTTSEPTPDTSDTQLQGRNLGQSRWTTLATGTPSSGVITESLEVRYLVDGTPTAIVLITAIRPTASVRITSFTSNKTTAFRGTPFTLKFAAETLFDDSQWRPTPRVKADVQYAPTLKARWTTVARAFINGGTGVKNLRATASGYWRVRVGTATATPLLIRVKKP